MDRHIEDKRNAHDDDAEGHVAVRLNDEDPAGPDFRGVSVKSDDDAEGHFLARQHEDPAGPDFRGVSVKSDDDAEGHFWARQHEDPAGPDFRGVSVKSDEDDAEGHKFVTSKDSVDGGPEIFKV